MGHIRSVQGSYGCMIYMPYDRHPGRFLGSATPYLITDSFLHSEMRNLICVHFQVRSDNSFSRRNKAKGQPYISFRYADYYYLGVPQLSNKKIKSDLFWDRGCNNFFKENVPLANFALGQCTSLFIKGTYNSPIDVSSVQGVALPDLFPYPSWQTCGNSASDQMKNALLFVA